MKRHYTMTAEAKTDFMYQWLRDANIYTPSVDQYN